MPIILALSVVGIMASFIMIRANISSYNARVLRSSMVKGSNLPLWGGSTDGKLTLGNTVLSEDGKTLAVQIKYDDVAHKKLSSFGTRYILRLVTTPENDLPGVKLRYGMFGTDSSGVLTIHSDRGFKNQAFIVMLVDRGYLVTSDDLREGTDSISESDIDKSITAQLAGDDEESSTTTTRKSQTTPPIFYMRLNAHNAKRSKENWKNDRDVVNSLFIKENISKKKKTLASLKKKIKRGKNTVVEMNRRLAENPDDEIAQEQLQDINQTLNDLNASVATYQASIKKLQDSVIKKDVLDPEQTKFTRFSVSSLDIEQ